MCGCFGAYTEALNVHLTCAAPAASVRYFNNFHAEARYLNISRFELHA